MKHGTSEVYLNANVAEVFFVQERFIAASLKQQNERETERRNIQVILNRNIMRHIVDTIVFLGGQGLSFRGHPELTKSLI